jgi:hypothetical protein
MTLRTFLCKVGWHRWEFRDYQTETLMVTQTRCRNPECHFHDHWLTVDLQRRPW